MDDGLLANVGIGIVFPIRSSSRATSAPVLMSTGTSLAAFGVTKDEFLERVFVMTQSVERGFAKTFSCDPDQFHVPGGKRLSQLSMERGLGILAG